MYLAKRVRPASNAAIDKIVFDYLKGHLIYGGTVNVEQYQEQEVTVFFLACLFWLNICRNYYWKNGFRIPIETIRQYQIYYLDACLFSFQDCVMSPLRKSEKDFDSRFLMFFDRMYLLKIAMEKDKEF